MPTSGSIKETVLRPFVAGAKKVREGVSFVVERQAATKADLDAAIKRLKVAARQRFEPVIKVTDAATEKAVAHRNISILVAAIINLSAQATYWTSERDHSSTTEVGITGILVLVSALTLKLGQAADIAGSSERKWLLNARLAIEAVLIPLFSAWFVREQGVFLMRQKLFPEIAFALSDAEGLALLVGLLGVQNIVSFVIKASTETEGSEESTPIKEETTTIADDYLNAKLAGLDYD